MEYTFLWYIENYSHCFHKIGEYLESPWFTPEGPEGACWTLDLYPRGWDNEASNFISLFLARNNEGMEMMLVKYELAILKADGSNISKKTDTVVFQQLTRKGFHFFVKIEEVLARKKSEYLPQDTLTVRCKMWLGEGTVKEIGQCRARTRIAIQKVSFLHLVENFSAIEPNQRQTFKIRLGEMERCIVSSLHCTVGESGEEQIIVEVTPTAIEFLSKCKLFLIDTSGNKIKWGQAQNQFQFLEDEIVTKPLSLSKHEIMDRKDEFLPEDKLSLVCECVFATGCEFQRVEDVVHKIPAMAAKFLSARGVTEKLPECSNVLDDMKDIYGNQFLTDVEIRTETKSYPAHKMVLCARSPVFQAKLLSDKKWINCDYIETKMEDDILKRLLLFLYCDKLEDLELETAIKLYKVANKGGIEKLKLACSKFLEDNLNPSTAAELLLLTDVHEVSDFKKVVEAYISNHDPEVFGSDN